MSVLVATKVKDAEMWLPRFITQVERLEGDIQKIIVMYGKSHDKSLAILKHWQNVSKHKIEIYIDPYIPPDERHGAKLTRVKQDIQKLLKESGADYYFNLDCDLVDIQQNAIPALMAHDKDIIAGMVWTEGREPKTFFDTFVYRMDGCRFHPYNAPGLTRTEPFSVDSVSTFYLAKSEVELTGEYSNPYPHIPFCEDLRKKGYGVWVDPLTHSWHIDLERVGIRHQPLMHTYSVAPFIDDNGAQHASQQIGALEFHSFKLNYDKWLLDTDNLSYLSSKMFMQTRSLITASIKVWKDAEFLPYTLKAIYDFVDHIDIVWGPVKARYEGTLAEAIKEDEDTYTAIRFFPDPEKKINLVMGLYENKEEIQEHLRQICVSKWMFFIDADEIYTAEAMASIRQFCEENQNGQYVYARPKKFINFWGDFNHVAYSLNPMSPFGEFAVPHPMLIWTDIPGLNFASFHTTPLDGFGRFFTRDETAYRGRVKVIEDIEVWHFGNAKNKAELKSKRDYYKARGDPNVYEEAFFTLKLPEDMILERGPRPSKFPHALRDHPRYKEKNRIQITRKQPYYRFRWVK